MYHTKNTDIHELDELVIPNCLLEAAELSENCDLDRIFVFQFTT